MNIIPYLIIAILPYFVFFISLFTLAILVSLLSNRKCQHICFCLESFLKTIEYFSFTATAIFTTRLLNSLVSFNKYFLVIIPYYRFPREFCNRSLVLPDSIYMESCHLVCGANGLAGFYVLWVST